jgi:ATP-dependent DNA helicase RecQ
VAYFGEKDSTACGVCDVCVKNKARPLDNTAVDHIAGLVIQHLQQPTHLSSLLQQLPNIPQERLMDVLQFLVSEEKIIRDKDGILRMS